MTLITHSKSLFLLIVLLLAVMEPQSQEVVDRKFNEQAMSSYAEQQAFDYMKYTARPPSVWERLGWWFQSMLQRFFLNPNTPWMTRIAYYVGLLAILGVALFYIIKLRYGGGVAPDYKRYRTPVSGIEISNPEEYEALMEQAVRDQNFKLAIRYLYLQTLLTLSKKGLIGLKDWKTPYDYERELNKDLMGSYRELARLFEYVWYGDFQAGESEYQKGQELLANLKGTL